MVWDVTFTCDICGKAKGEANHWWMASVGSVPCVEPDPQDAFEKTFPDQRFTLLRWSRADSQNPDIYHLCGQGCALQAMERFMNEGRIEAD